MGSRDHKFIFPLSIDSVLVVQKIDISFQPFQPTSAVGLKWNFHFTRTAEMKFSFQKNS